ncbi:MAG: hypothetical protein QXX84_06935 [Sulfolobales archaeon]
MVEVKLPVITSYGVFNGLEINEGVIDTIIFNWNADPKPVPVKIGHIQPDDSNKEKELADGVITSLFKENGGLWCIAKLPYETYKYLLEGRLIATSPEIRVEMLNDKEKNYFLVGLALLGNSEPAIPTNYVVKFSKETPFKKVEEEVLYYSHFRKSDWSEDDVFFTTEWDKDKAMRDVVEEKGWETLARCCLAVVYRQGEDTSEYPEAFSRYKFPFAELREGKLVINSKAVATAKAYLNGARGVEINEELADLVEPLVEYLYELVQRAREKEREREEMSKREGVLFKKVFKTEGDDLTIKIINAFEKLGLKIRR